VTAEDRDAGALQGLGLNPGAKIQDMRVAAGLGMAGALCCHWVHPKIFFYPWPDWQPFQRAPRHGGKRRAPKIGCSPSCHRCIASSVS